jgi:hypothetical protein
MCQRCVTRPDVVTSSLGGFEDEGDRVVISPSFMTRIDLAGYTFLSCNPHPLFIPSPSLLWDHPLGNVVSPLDEIVGPPSHLLGPKRR